MKVAAPGKKYLFYGALAMVIGGGIGLFVVPSLTSAPANVSLLGTDTVGSWHFDGAYTGDAGLVTHAKKEIEILKSKAGTASYPAYETYVGIASQYELLGDGKRAYEYLQKAIALDPKKGIAYFNLGHLMEVLGAYVTARGAYEQAVAVEPRSAAYKAAHAAFMREHFPNE